MMPNMMKAQPFMAEMREFAILLISSVSAWFVTTPALMPELVIISAM
jgi:hypothetical protein